MNRNNLVLIRGAGDLASGIALRLWRAGFAVVMTEIAVPTTIRRTVAFSQAVVDGACVVEDLEARRAENPREALALLERGILPVLVDPDCRCRAAPSSGMLRWRRTRGWKKCARKQSVGISWMPPMPC